MKFLHQARHLYPALMVIMLLISLNTGTFARARIKNNENMETVAMLKVQEAETYRANEQADAETFDVNISNSILVQDVEIYGSSRVLFSDAVLGSPDSYAYIYIYDDAYVVFQHVLVYNCYIEIYDGATLLINETGIAEGLGYLEITTYDSSKLEMYRVNSTLASISIESYENSEIIINHMIGDYYIYLLDSAFIEMYDAQTYSYSELKLYNQARGKISSSNITYLGVYNDAYAEIHNSQINDLCIHIIWLEAFPTSELGRWARAWINSCKINKLSINSFKQTIINDSTIQQITYNWIVNSSSSLNDHEFSGIRYPAYIADADTTIASSTADFTYAIIDTSFIYKNRRANETEMYLYNAQLHIQNATTSDIYAYENSQIDIMLNSIVGSKMYAENSFINISDSEIVFTVEIVNCTFFYNDTLSFYGTPTFDFKNSNVFIKNVSLITQSWHVSRSNLTIINSAITCENYSGMDIDVSNVSINNTKITDFSSIDISAFSYVPAFYEHYPMNFEPWHTAVFDNVTILSDIEVIGMNLTLINSNVSNVKCDLYEYNQSFYGFVHLYNTLVNGWANYSMQIYEGIFSFNKGIYEGDGDYLASMIYDDLSYINRSGIDFLFVSSADITINNSWVYELISIWSSIIIDNESSVYSFETYNCTSVLINNSVIISISTYNSTIEIVNSSIYGLFSMEDGVIIPALLAIDNNYITIRDSYVGSIYTPLEDPGLLLTRNYMINNFIDINNTGLQLIIFSTNGTLEINNSYVDQLIAILGATYIYNSAANELVGAKYYENGGSIIDNVSSGETFNTIKAIKFSSIINYYNVALVLGGVLTVSNSYIWGMQLNGTATCDANNSRISRIVLLNDAEIHGVNLTIDTELRAYNSSAFYGKNITLGTLGSSESLMVLRDNAYVELYNCTTLSPIEIDDMGHLRFNNCTIQSHINAYSDAMLTMINGTIMTKANLNIYGGNIHIENSSIGHTYADSGYLYLKNVILPSSYSLLASYNATIYGENVKVNHTYICYAEEFSIIGGYDGANTNANITLIDSALTGQIYGYHYAIEGIGRVTIDNDTTEDPMNVVRMLTKYINTNTSALIEAVTFYIAGDVKANISNYMMEYNKCVVRLIINVSVIDTTPPNITLLNDTTITLEFGMKCEIHWEISEENPYKVVVKVNGTEKEVIYNYPSTIIFNLMHYATEPGLYIITLRAYDKALNYADSDTVNVTLAPSIPPEVTSDIDEVEYELGMSAEVAWNISEDYPDYYEIYLNGTIIATGTYTSGTTITLTISDYITDSGTYNVSLVAYDKAGNAGKCDIRVIAYPSEAPSITSSPEAEYNITTEQYLLLNWTASDRYPHEYVIYVNQTIVKTGTWISGVEITYNFTATEVGTYIVKIVFTDKAGNSTENTVTINVAEAEEQPPPGPRPQVWDPITIGIISIGSITIVTILAIVILKIRRK